MRNSPWVNDFNLGWTSLISIIFCPEIIPIKSWKFTVPAFRGRLLIFSSALWCLETKFVNHWHNKVISITKKMQRCAKATPFLSICLHQHCSKGQETDLESFPYIFCRGISKTSWRDSEPDKLVDNLKNTHLSRPLRCAQCPHRSTPARGNWNSSVEIIK